MKVKIEIEKASWSKILAILVAIELGCLIYFAHSYSSKDKVEHSNTSENESILRTKFQDRLIPCQNVSRPMIRLESKFLLI